MSLLASLAEVLSATESCRLLVGEVRAVLRTLPAESVHLAVTSPPYWNLRDYGVEPVVWGGDENCQHRWETETRHSRNRNWEEVAGESSGKQRSNKDSIVAGQNGYLCAVCDGWLGSSGQEPTPELYIHNLVLVFRELKRVLRKDGLFFLNLGDTSYRGQWAMVPARVAIALQEDGWLLRSEIIWAKPNPMPESVKNRPTKAHEMLYMFAKTGRYFYDSHAVLEPLGEVGLRALDGKLIYKKQGKHSADRNDARLESAGVSVGDRINPAGRNRRDVWWLSSEPLKDEHYAAFPTKLVEPCVLAGTSERGVCPQCGKPWERVLERKGGYPSGGHQCREDCNELEGGTKTQQVKNFGNIAAVIEKYGMPVYSTTGWKQTCSCPPQEPGSATVLDPFSGSGTTAVVCRRLGRDYIGIDLKSEYHDIARRRLEREQQRAKISKTSAPSRDGA